MSVSFSVLMSIYCKEDCDNLDSALKSIVEQTLLPSEIILIKDGPLYKELDNVINTFQESYSNLFKVISLEENLGLGGALRIGLENCSNNIIARMDTDDICRNNRFEKQFNFLANHLEYDIVGTNIEEFNTVPGDLKRFKINPELHSDLVRQIKLKSPFNHPSIMFRKKSILEAGNYNGDLPLFEDYALFLRLWLNGAKFYNIQEPLLNFRVGTGIATIKRRSGLHYLKKEWNFVKYAKKIGAFNYFDVIRYIVLKFPIRLLPPYFVLFIYNTFLRKEKINTFAVIR